MSVPWTHSCPLCGAPPAQQSVRNEFVYGGTLEQHFWICASCDAIYLYPATTDQEDTEFYEHEFDKWMIKRSGDETWTEPAIQFLKMQGRELPLRLPYLQRYVKSGQRVLEIGSSSGFTLAALRDMGCACVGVELSQPYAEHARGLGIKTYTDWESLTAGEPERFDVVLHYYVLEHITDPLGFLQACWRYVAPGGRMLFEVPSGTEPLTSLYHLPAFDRFYWWRAHHWYFTPKSLGFLLDRFGRPYEIFPGQRYDLSNHLHWMLTGQPGGMSRYDHIFSTATLQSYAEDLKRNWLCDYQIAVVS